jgi:hypothetical protein
MSVSVLFTFVSPAPQLTLSTRLEDRLDGRISSASSWSSAMEVGCGGECQEVEIAERQDVERRAC